jgi:hypothetical protein
MRLRNTQRKEDGSTEINIANEENIADCRAEFFYVGLLGWKYSTLLDRRQLFERAFSYDIK